MRFEDFLDHHVGRLARYATVLTGDPHQAQDIVQEVLTRAHQRWSRIDGMDQPGAYVKRMVTNEFLSWRRRRSTRDLSLAALDDVAPPVADPTGVVDDRAELLDGLTRLPRKQRAAVVLRYYENQTYAEIAEELRCSEGTVRSHVSRAITTLRAAMSAPVEEKPMKETL